MANYDSTYYKENNQSEDRPALKFYYRLFNKEIKSNAQQKSVLEYGCGVGNLTKRLVANFDVTALDISDYALSQVNIKAPKAKTVKSMSKVRNSSLDGVIALHVMEHIELPDRVFKEFNKALKPNGLLMFVVPNPDGFGRKIKKEKWFGFSDETHISLLSEKEWINSVKNSGFVVKKVYGDGMWDVPYLPLVPGIIQKIFIFPFIALQVLTLKLYIPTIFGECLIVICRKV